MGFLQTNNNDFVLDGKKINLRGYGLGSWMNMENFMIGLPGTDYEIYNAFVAAYGKKRADEFYDRLLNNMFCDEDAIYMKSLGLNTLRLPFCHRYFIDDKNISSFKKDGFKYIDRVVQICKKHGIYTILDLHTSPGAQNPDWHAGALIGRPLFWEFEGLQDTVISLWRYLADYYKDEDGIAGFDILNEPVNVPDYDVFNRFINKTIKAIREVDKKHIIFIEGDDWAKKFGMIELDDTENLAWSLHLYPGNIRYDYKDEHWNPESMVKEFGIILDSMKKYNFPVWCGETGISDRSEFREKAEEMTEQYTMLRDILKYMNEINISWTVWCYKDARCMGTVRPRVDSKWNQLVNSMKKDWQRFGMQELAQELNKVIPFYDELDELSRSELDYTTKAQLNTCWSKTVLVKALKEIDFEELITYADSFLFENCEKQENFARIIKEA